MSDTLLCATPRDLGMKSSGEKIVSAKIGVEKAEIQKVEARKIDLESGDNLQEVMSAMVRSARHEAGAEASSPAPRPALKLCVIETKPAAKSAAPILLGPIASGPASARPGRRAAIDDDPSELGRGGLRLAFWLCGFHDALMDRRRNGERLTEREEALLTLSRGDFTGIRPLVIKQALDRLDAVVNSAEWQADDVAFDDGPCDDETLAHSIWDTGAPSPAPTAARADKPGPMEKFALDTLRDLSRRAQQLFEDEGPDAALSLFDKNARVQEPLAIFQLVFTTALGLVETFAKSVDTDAKLLNGLAEALGSEVERV